VYEGLEKFKSGRTSMAHEERAGCLSTFTNDKKIQQAREMVLANWQVTIDEVASSLSWFCLSNHP
jgi:hypothetical protein